MSKESHIASIVDRASPGLLDSVSKQDGITKEELVRKVLRLSHGKKLRTHQNGDKGAAELTKRANDGAT